MEQYLTLIQRTFSKNELGQQIPIETRTRVMAKEQSVTRSEFYSAMDKYTPTIVFEIRGYEYDGQEEVETEDGKRFKVIRSYRTDYEDVELTCEYKS